MTAPLVEVRDLRTYFTGGRRGAKTAGSAGTERRRHRRFVSRSGRVRAVDGVSLTIRPGETYALVGESGCGKSTTGRSILRLVEPTSGSVIFDARDVLAAGPAELRRLKREMQIVFQDPYSSLTPRMRVRDIVAEPLIVHRMAERSAARREAARLLDLCGLPAATLRRFPHEFSGGQRQRVAIARALATHPRFIVADEPVSALDVSIQAQILALLEDLQGEFGLTYLFISHDLAVVRATANRVGVMYLGKIVEESDTGPFFADPGHPYSRALLSAVPRENPDDRRERILLSGDIPSAAHPPAGCRFHTRCPLVTERCRREEPHLETWPDGRRVACHVVKGPTRTDPPRPARDGVTDAR